MTKKRNKRTKLNQHPPKQPIVDPSPKAKIEKVNEFWNTLESTSHPDDFLYPEQIIVGSMIQLKEAHTFNIGLCIGELRLAKDSYVVFKKYLDEKKSVLQVAYHIDQNLSILFEVPKEKITFPYGVVTYHEDGDPWHTTVIG